MRFAIASIGISVFVASRCAAFDVMPPGSCERVYVGAGAEPSLWIVGALVFSFVSCDGSAPDA